jgi:hypothetical protein
MRRELGLPTRPRNTVLHQPSVLPEDVNFKKSIQQPRCLVSLELCKWDEERLKVKIEELHSFQRNPRFDYKSFCPGTELSKCYKRIMNWESNRSGPFTKKQIIVGIQLRAQEVFPNYPDYVERFTKKLDETVNWKIYSLYHSIWFTERK